MGAPDTPGHRRLRRTLSASPPVSGRERSSRKVSGVSEPAARESPVVSGTALQWLVAHLAYAERLWMIHRFAGGEMPSPATTYDTVDAALTPYRDTWAAVDAVIAAAPSLDELSVGSDAGRPGHAALDPCAST